MATDVASVDPAQRGSAVPARAAVAEHPAAGRSDAAS